MSSTAGLPDFPDPSLPGPAREQPRATKRRTSRGWALRVAGVCLLLVALFCIAWQNRDSAVVRRALPTPLRRSPTVRAPNRSPSPSVEPANPETPNDDQSSAAAVLQSVAESVVLIESDGPIGMAPIGCGFVVDRSGRIATSLHVTREATEATVRFQDGSVFEVAGYAAVDPAKDLALLKLKSARDDWPAATLEFEDPPQLASVVAIGHPQGLAFAPYDGRVSLLLRSSQLTQGSQRFLSELTGGNADLHWVQHTAHLSDGNSGGPLLNAAGRVIGINTWVDRQTGFSYALQSAELQALLDQPATEIEPLEKYATAEARLRSALGDTSAEQLRKWRDEAQAMRWRPQSPADYAVLQRLAWAVTLANNPDLFAARTTLAGRLDALTLEADRVVAQLREEKWNDIGQVTLLNEYASQQVLSPAAGVMAFVTVERIVEGPRGQRAAIVQLAGFSQPLLVPLDGTLSAPEAGSQLLLVGVNNRGLTVRYGDNPLQPIVAPIIVAPVLVPLGM